MVLTPPGVPALDLGRGAWCALVEGFVADHEALMAQLVGELPLRAETIVIAGQAFLTPRLTSWHGDAAARYTYSRRTFVPEPWTAGLALVRERLAEVLGVRFDAVLANYYRDGQDAMGWHADDEPELGPRAPDDVLIASVSLGAARRFLLAPKKRGADAEGGLGGTRAFELGGGSLFVMGGSTQRWFRHRLARTVKPVGPRLNLTFRIVSAGP